MIYPIDNSTLTKEKTAGIDCGFAVTRMDVSSVFTSLVVDGDGVEVFLVVIDV